MKRRSGQLTARRLIAVAGAGVLLSAGLGVAAASAADRAAGAVPATRATSVPMVPCAIKYAAGNLYVGASDAVYQVSQQTGAATRVAPGFTFPQGFGQACGVAVDGTGNVLVADGEVVVVAAKTGTFYGKKMSKGHVYPIAAGFQGITGAVDAQLDPSGNVVITVGGESASHTDNEQDSQIFVLAERAGTFYGKKMAKGKLYVLAGVLNGGGSPSPCDPPDTATRDAATSHAATSHAATKATKANLGFTIGTLRFDVQGNIILADSGGDSGSPCGALTWDVPARVAVVPARTGTYYGQKMTVGYLYAIAGLGTKTGNGVPAVDSDLPAVSAVALDHAGNILVATGNNGFAHAAVRVIAAKAGTFYGKKMVKGDIYALPGGLNGANAVAVDSAGNVLAGNIGDFLVQMLAEKTGTYYGVKARAGHVYTIAGTGRPPV
jgi:hypothetical protein